jgi:hypothetical protein
MTYGDPNSPAPQRPPEVDPLAPIQTGSPRYGDGDVDQSTWNPGVIAATILAALIVVDAIVWATTDDEETATNSPPTTMGRAPRPPAR